MENQKLENELNLALDTSEEERQKSLDLNVGYDEQNNTWELIVKYNGDLAPIQAEIEGMNVIPLESGYAIVTVPQNQIQNLANYSQVEFIEKPKQLLWEITDAKTASCINRVQEGNLSLFGSGVLVAVLDSGIDYSHPDFRNADGTTRIIALWDQTGIGPPPEGFQAGTLYTSEMINEALSRSTKAEQLEIVPSIDFTGHGTAVAGVCAGNGRASDGLYAGVATQSDLLIVKLGIAGVDAYPRTTQLMQGLTFVIREALRLQKPIVINISYGTNYGSHDGKTLLENYIDDICNIWKSNVVVAAGNEGASRRHFLGTVVAPYEMIAEIAVAENERSLNLQLWKSYLDVYDISLVAPNGRRIGPIPAELGTQRFVMNETRVLIYYGEPSPYNQDQEIFIEFLPVYDYINDGIWQVIITPIRVVDGEVNMWLPATDTVSPSTRFLNPNATITLTIPATSSRAISVGAYDSNNDSVAGFSGQGYIRGTEVIKPDLVAPGVNIISSAVGGGYSSNTGTSIAAPFVTGSVALMMEYGIVRGNDSYLYGEKVKSYLLSGATRSGGMMTYPNRIYGYGRLCLRNSLPGSNA